MGDWLAGECFEILKTVLSVSVKFSNFKRYDKMDPMDYFPASRNSWFCLDIRSSYDNTRKNINMANHLFTPWLYY